MLVALYPKRVKQLLSVTLGWDFKLSMKLSKNGDILWPQKEMAASNKIKKL